MPLIDTAEIWKVLKAFGLNERKLALSDLDDARLIAQQVCDQLGCICENEHVQSVWELIHDCQMSEPIQKRLRGGHRIGELQVSDDSGSRTTNFTVSAASSSSRRIPNAADTSRPLGVKHRIVEGQENARQQREQRLRDKWSKELYKELVKVNSIALSGMEFCVGVDRLHLALAGKTRTSTLRRYVKVWQDWQNWRKGSWGDNGKAHPSVFCEYLFTRFDEPCGRTIPGLIVKAVHWFEKIACFEVGERVSENRMVCQIRDYIVEQLSKDGPPPRRAPRYPAIVIEALETMVVTENAALGLRILAWAKLIKIWGALRFDDLQKIHPANLSMHGGRLTTTLRITKTSGPGKRVQELPVCISEHAYIWDGSWLKQGFELLREAANFDRDYLLPRFNEEWTELYRKCASYSDVATYSCSLRKALRSQSTYDSLLPDDLVSFWTEHSERATLPTGLAMLGVSKPDRDLVGRWKPDASDSYVRSYNGLVAKLQQRFAVALRKQDRSKILDEIDIVESASSWMEARKMEIAATERETIVEQFRISLEEFHEMEAGLVDGSEIDDDTRLRDLVKDKSEVLGMRKMEEERDHGYVVVHNSGRCRRLHKVVGGCWLARTRRFKSAEEYDKLPDQAAFTHVCKVCWPSRPGCEESSDESSSYSSSSDDSVEDVLSE